MLRPPTTRSSAPVIPTAAMPVSAASEILRRELVGDCGDAKCAHSGSGRPFVSGMNGTVASPIRNTRHIVTPAYRIGSGYPA